MHNQSDLKISRFHNIFFIGVAGTGMSALAQYLSGIGKEVSGSDRYFTPGSTSDIRQKLEASGVACYLQDGSGITENTELVVVSTAIEDSVPEVQKARQLSIPVIRRSQLLALISEEKKTIAVGGTSGKSTTSAMIFDILREAGMDPSIISGAGLVSLIKEGKIGNAYVGKGEWLIIEADESDGSIIQYHPEAGLLLNIDKDHQEMEELISIFTSFREHTSALFIVNRCNVAAAALSRDINVDFSSDEQIRAGFMASGFVQNGMTISFLINGTPFSMNTIGKHNMENALAATAVAASLGVGLEVCSKALSGYEGIYRRHQLLGVKKGVYVIDDYAHNPVKCAASIEACQHIAPKVVAWFQPHGYGPTRFLKDDFIHEFSGILRSEDEIWMSEIYYAGGTAVKDISSNDLIKEILANGKKAYFIENRDDLLESMRPHLEEGSVLLLMGARDPGLEAFCHQLYEAL